jgi:hypothetical protein
LIRAGRCTPHASQQLVELVAVALDDARGQSLRASLFLQLKLPAIILKPIARLNAGSILYDVPIHRRLREGFGNETVVRQLHVFFDKFKEPLNMLRPSVGGEFGDFGCGIDSRDTTPFGRLLEKMRDQERNIFAPPS